MQTPDLQEVPGWVSALIAAMFGGGAVKMMSVWLENRRLSKKDYRETLLERIRELEKVVSSLQVRIGNLRVEVAHLEAENTVLRRKVGLPTREEEQQAHDELPPGESDAS